MTASEVTEVLISEGRHADSYHLELGVSGLAACGKNAQADREFTRVTLAEAEEELGRDPCGQCPFPDEWASSYQDETADSAEQIDQGDDAPRYQREEELRLAYEEAGTIKGASESFDACYWTIREWLIEYGIHTPEPRRSYSAAARLEEIGSRQEDASINGGA